MTRPWVLVGAALLVVGGGLLAHGPFGHVPGGPLFGELVEEPVTDWSFTAPHREIEVETRLLGFVPYSVTVWCASREGRLYISADDGEGKWWVGAVRARPEARLRIGGKLYPVRFVEVVAEAERTAIWRLELAKYFGVGLAAPLPPEHASPPAGAVRFEVVSRAG